MKIIPESGSGQSVRHIIRHPRLIMAVRSLMLAGLLIGCALPLAGRVCGQNVRPAAGAPASDGTGPGRFRVEPHDDRLQIVLGEQPVAEYVFRDAKVLRPYLSQVRTASGMQVTRNHPPVEGVDATDHDTMHPGLWLALGDLSGADFWRNRARMEHLRFTEMPRVLEDRLLFTTESQLLTAEGRRLCILTSRMTFAPHSAGWLVIWDATFASPDAEIVFGDQEEMGFGARVATPLTEKNGGQIISSTGRKTAKATWGQPAAWCDYSGRIGERSAGITLMASPKNFRECWWHNRDYGVFVANPFGRAAMKQGEVSAVRVPAGDGLRVCFGAVIHEGADYDPTVAWQQFLKLREPE